VGVSRRGSSTAAAAIAVTADGVRVRVKLQRGFIWVEELAFKRR
jgi:hypothetical protein